MATDFKDMSSNEQSNNAFKINTLEKESFTTKIVKSVLTDNNLQPIDEPHLEIEKLQKDVNNIINYDASQMQILPPVAVKLLSLTNDKSSSIADLAFIIETESSLSIEILQLVNSAYYQLPHKISSIKRAVTFLGFSLIRQIALNLLFFKKLIRRKAKAKFNQVLYWQHSLFVAVLSKFIAMDVKHKDPDLLYSAGLFHDFGKLILENYGKLSYSDFINHFEKSDNPSLNNELTFFGVTHAQIGAVYCQQAGLPISICTVILNHHHSIDNLNYFEKYSPQTQQNIAIIAYANYIAWLQKIGSNKSDQAPKLSFSILKIIDKLQLNIESILHHADKEMEHIGQFYNIHFPSLIELRSNLINSIFSLNLSKQNQSDEIKKSQIDRKNQYLYSMTIPHHSLDPEEFIPWTLEAIQQQFNFDRLILLDINPKKRSLIARYSWPNQIISGSDKVFEIMLSSLSGRLIHSLRSQQPMLINDKHEENQLLLKKLQVDCFFSLPILNNNRLTSVLYIDNFISKNSLDKTMLPKLSPIISELGIALANAKQFEKEKKKAQIDPLTGLNNKMMINKVLTDLFNKQQDQDSAVKNYSIGFIDIDFFKIFNDNYGHQAGDDVLKITADILKSLTRPSDFIGRYGGEEFLFILINSDKKGVKTFSERIRFEIEAKGKILNKRFPKQNLTVSIGVASNPNNYTSYQEMIDAADAAMYQSKKNGRNKVTII